MPTGNGFYRNTSGLGNAGLLPAAVEGGRKKVWVERFDLSNAAVAKAINDDNLCFDIPRGEAPLSLRVSSTVSLTTSQLRFGTRATNDLLGAAKAYGTTADAVIEYLRASVKGVPLTANTRVFMGITAANLPSSGVIVVEFETSGRG